MTRVFERADLARLAAEIDHEVEWLLNRMYVENMVVDEEDFSQLLVAKISATVDSYKLNLKPKLSYGMSKSSGQNEIQLESLEIDGRPLGRKGEGSEEKVCGADMLFFLETSGIANLAPQKGILAQAKRWTGDFHFTKARDLYGKCGLMNGITEHSYVFIYAPNGLFVFENPITFGVPRLNAKDCEISIGDLVANFIDCSIGDVGITEKDGERFLPVATALKEGRLGDAARAIEGAGLMIKASG